MAANFSYLSYLNLSLRSNSNSGLIYANTRNQVELIVNFIALDDNGKQVFLTDAQMQSTISLCDYFTRGTINNGWSVSQQAGDFVSDGILLDHASSYTAFAKEEKKESLSALKSGLDGYLLPQSFTLWVSAANSVTTAKSFAVKISDGDKTTYDSAINGNFESSILLEPVVEKSYVMDDMFLSPDAYIYYNGDGTLKKHSNFFSFKDYKLCIKRVDGIPSDSDTLICSSFALWNAASRYVYIDGLNSGDKINVLVPDGTSLTYDKNERKEYLCFSLFNIEHVGEVSSYHKAVNITIYDQYGNNGHFNVDVNSPSAEVIKVVIKDA
ncbi:hypothetical protein ACEZEZ_00280 [Kluyvera ascorbata]|uniref:hypothetical protein n=1 Tax=Kluyvera ascorbata TaxID=51288 RepID=UPI0035CCCE9E